MSVDKQTIVVGGLPVNVFTSKSQQSNNNNLNDKRPVFIMFFLHGRNGSAEQLNGNVEDLFGQIGSKTAKELVIVTFDHRNHGHRIVDPKANNGWKANPRHAIDMYAMQTGSARDVSYLIDFLPAYLYPNDDRNIVQWGIAGRSLGGHSTWIALSQEPRLTVGIPIIACPDFLTLMNARAEKFGIKLEGSTYLPNSLLNIIRESDPVSTEYRQKDERNPFWNKSILVLSGGCDLLVPWSASEAFVDGLETGDKGLKKVVVQPDAAHELTPEMLKEMVKFLSESVLG